MKHVVDRPEMRSLLFALLLAISTLGYGQVPPSRHEFTAYTGLHAVAWRGNASLVANAGQVELEARDSRGRTPIHVATYARNREVIRALAEKGADLEALEHDRYDAVTIAAVADDKETLALLLELGASAKMTTSRYDGTALIAAAHLGHDGVVRQLIAAGAPLDHVNNLHWTAPIEAVVLGDGGPRHQATVKALLDAGANTSLTDREGRTALDLAQQYGYAVIAGMISSARN